MQGNSLISNTASGAATGAAIGGPWGALLGGGAGMISSFFGDDSDARAKAQAAYQRQMAAATDEYTGAQNQVLDAYGNLYTPEGVASAKTGYTSALTSADPTQYSVNASDYQSTYSDPLSSWKRYLDPSIAYQQESARKNVEESAAGQGGLYSGSAANEISRNVADIASTGYNDAYNKARQAGQDVNTISGENFSRNVNAGNYNSALAQTNISNLGTAYGAERDLMDTQMSGISDLNKTRYDAATGMAQTNLSGALGQTGGPSTWDSLIGGVTSANDAGLFNKSFWDFG